MYNEEAIPVDYSSITWWPTNFISQHLVSDQDEFGTVETKQLSVVYAAALLVSMTLFQVGWTAPGAIVAWSVVAVATFAVALGWSIVKHQSRPLSLWIFSAPIAFEITNFFALGCSPLAHSNGRFLTVSLLGTVAVSCSIDHRWGGISGLVHIALFVAICIVEGVATQCFDVPAASHSAIVDIAFQALLPLSLLGGILVRIQLAQQQISDQRSISDNFARRCIRAALSREPEKLQQIVDEYDSSNAPNPTLSDDAIGVIVALLAAPGMKRRDSAMVQHDTLRVPSMSNARASYSSDDERSVSPNNSDHGRRRSSAVALAPAVVRLPPPVKGRSLVVAFALPHLSAYISMENAATELLKLVLTEFADSCSTVCERYQGRTLFSSFNVVYAQFPTVAMAAAASLGLLTLAEKDSRHHRDPTIIQSRCLVPLTVLLQTETFVGSFGTNAATNIGHVAARELFGTIIAKFSQQLASPTALAGSGMRPALEPGFTLEVSPNPTILFIQQAKELHADGLPVAPPTAAALVMDEVYPLPSFDLMEARKSLVVNLLENERSIAEIAASGAAATPSSKKLSASGRPGSGARPMSGSRRKTISSLPSDVLECWRKFDVDGNGVLDYEEMRDVFEELGYQLNEEEMEQFYAEVDADDNGVISLDEFAAAFFSPSIGGAAMMKKVRNAGLLLSKTLTNGDIVPFILRAWQKYDVDGSNALEPEELMAVLKDLKMDLTKEEAQWLVQKLDHDGSGAIEFEEFVHLFADETAAKQLSAMARIQGVSRVVSNKLNEKSFSTEDQDLRDFKLAAKATTDKYLLVPLLFYICYNCGRITLRVSWGPQLGLESTTQIIVDLCLDTFWLVLVLLKLFVLPREQRGLVIYKPRETLRAYAASGELFIDLIAMFPADFIYIGIGFPHNGGILAYYRLNKLLLIYYFDDCYKVAVGHISPAFARASKAVAYFLCLCHIFACGLICLARSVGENAEGMDGVVGSFGLLSGESLTYIKAIYWAIMGVAGQISGPILPILDDQLAILIALVLLGLPMYTVVLGTIGQAVQVDDAYERYLNKIDGLRSYFQYTGLPEEIETQCVSYYRHLYNTTGSLDLGENPMANLPPELAIQVTIQMGQETLRKVAIFRDACSNLEFVHELTTKLQPKVIPPLTVVMRKGERGTNMYFVTFGDFHVVNDATNAVVFTLRKGNFFGEIALLHKVKRTATIRSFHKFSNVLVLDKKDFDEVTATFPECLSLVYKDAEDRIKQVLALEAEEERKEKEKLRELRKKAKEVTGQSDDEEDATLQHRQSQKKRELAKLEMSTTST